MQVAYKPSRPIVFPNLPVRQKRISLLTFWGLAIMGFARQKGDDGLFGHNAPMDWNMVAWIAIFLLSFGPLVIYIWLI